MWQGKVHSIYITPTAGDPTQPVEQVHAVPSMGLQGDRHFGPSEKKRPGGGRDITLIALEDIQAIVEETGIQFTPADARRNIVTQGLALNDLVGCEFFVGGVALRGVRLCEPCQHLASLTDARLLPALVHRGGLRADIINEGDIRVGDLITSDNKV